MAISLVNSYFAASNLGGDTSTLSTPSFTPTNGELFVIKASTWDAGTASGTPSGGGLTYSQKTVSMPGGPGFSGYIAIFTAVVSGSPGSMAVTLSAPAGSCHHSMVVERWSGAQVAGSPAVISPIKGLNATFSTSITTTAANSVVTWACVDEKGAPQTAVGRTYLSGAVETGISDGYALSASTHYYAYQVAATAGVKTVGMSLPDPQDWTTAGIEIQASFSASSSAFMAFFS